MKFSNSEARVWVPDGRPVDQALKGITHLGIGAHQDDLEIMAYHGIQECYLRSDASFGGVTCTDGRGSSRTGPYAGFTDDQMRAVRVEEQNTAAMIGRYGVMIQLGHPSRSVKEAGDRALREDIVAILGATRPKVVYTHNPADKHETHIGVFAATIQAIRDLPMDRRPEKVLGCEVWRGLDWMLDEDKTVLDVSARENLFQSLVGVFDSQVAGGKRYDLATLGRARANATYFQSHATDAATHLWLAMDLTPLAVDDRIEPVAYVEKYLARFVSDVVQKLRRRMGV